jgi:hypothetical protein
VKSLSMAQRKGMSFWAEFWVLYFAGCESDTMLYTQDSTKSHGTPGNLEPHIPIVVFVLERVISREQVPHTSGEIL